MKKYIFVLVAAFALQGCGAIAGAVIGGQLGQRIGNDILEKRKAERALQMNKKEDSSAPISAIPSIEEQMALANKE